MFAMSHRERNSETDLTVQIISVLRYISEQQSIPSIFIHDVFVLQQAISIYCKFYNFYSKPK